MFIRRSYFQIFFAPENEGGGDPPPAKTFSQDEVNRIVQERLAKDRKDRPSDESIEELRAKAARADELEAAQRTATEQAEHDAQERARQAQELEAAAQTRVDQANARLIAAEVSIAATKANAVSGDAVLRFIDSSALSVGTDGAVTGADEAVKAALEANPFLVNSSPAPVTAPGSPVSLDSGVRPTGTSYTAEQVQVLARDNPGEFNRAMDAGEISLADLG